MIQSSAVRLAAPWAQEFRVKTWWKSLRWSKVMEEVKLPDGVSQSSPKFAEENYSATPNPRSLETLRKCWGVCLVNNMWCWFQDTQNTLSTFSPGVDQGVKHFLVCDKVTKVDYRRWKGRSVWSSHTWLRSGSFPVGTSLNGICSVLLIRSAFGNIDMRKPRATEGRTTSESNPMERIFWFLNRQDSLVLVAYWKYSSLLVNSRSLIFLIQNLILE